MELQVRNNQLSATGATIATVSPSSFVQQGTVDWPSLAKVSVNASVSVLTRFSGCGVEIWTTAFAQIVLSTLRLSVSGELHLNEALAKLHSFGSYGNVMHFGFGIKHVVRILADSSEGMAVVAFCAAVAESHSLPFSTQVIQVYAKIYSAKAASNITSSYRQWEVLVRSCSEVLAQSSFGLVVEFFVRFHRSINRFETRCGTPAQIASALQSLAKIFNGNMRSMTLIDESECGFVAVIAQWLLSLNVVVQNADENIVYSTTGARVDGYHLMIIYSNENEVSKSVRRAENTYYIDSFRNFLSESQETEYLSERIE